MADDRRNEKPATLVRRTALVEGVSRPVVTPIQPSVVYASPSIDMLHAQYEGRETGYTYAREGHPNATLLAQKIDALVKRLEKREDFRTGIFYRSLKSTWGKESCDFGGAAAEWEKCRKKDEEAIEEELRLMYVAATRARNHLYFVCPMQSYDRGSGMMLSRPSRFIADIPKSILQRWHADLY